MIAELPQANDGNFDQMVFSDPLPAMVEFFSPMCPHCRRMAPTIAAVARDYAGRVRVIQVNAPQSATLGKRFGIRGVPTMLFFAGGIEVDRLIGESPREILEAHLNQVLGQSEQKTAATGS